MEKGLVKNVTKVSAAQPETYVKYLESSFTLMVTNAIAARLHLPLKLILSCNTTAPVLLLFSVT
jgi:hypothetical protein